MYGSAGSLHKAGNELPIEAFEGGAAGGAAFTDEVVLSTALPHLPQSVKWWGTNFLVGSRNEHMSLPAYPKGYLAGVYSIAATTNFLGNELPLEWKFALYVPIPTKQVTRANGVTLFETLAGMVTNVLPLAYRGDFLPSIGTRPVTIHEWRLAGRTGRGEQYPAMINGNNVSHWPGRDDPYFKYLARKRNKAVGGDQ